MRWIRRSDRERNHLFAARGDLNLEPCLHTAVPDDALWYAAHGASDRLGMEQKQQEWMQAVTEALSDLLAARVAQATLLEAMMVSHPDPVMLRKAWDELSSQRIAYVAQKRRSPPIRGRWMPTRLSSSRRGKKSSAATFRVRRMQGARMREPARQQSSRAT